MTLVAVPAHLGVIFDRQFKASGNCFHCTVVRDTKWIGRAIRVPRRDSEDKVGIIAWGAAFVVVGNTWQPLADFGFTHLVLHLADRLRFTRSHSCSLHAIAHFMHLLH